MSAVLAHIYELLIAEHQSQTAEFPCSECRCHIKLPWPSAGSFDVKILKDNWIRVACTKGTKVVLQRASTTTIDEGNHLKVRATVEHALAYINTNTSTAGWSLSTDDACLALRLFLAEPAWTSHDRPQDDLLLRAMRSTSIGLPTSSNLLLPLEPI